MMLRDLLNLDTGIIGVSDCSSFGRLRLDDKSKTHLAIMLALAGSLDLRLWCSENTMQLFISGEDGLVSEGISLTSASALSGAVTMLDFMKKHLMPTDTKPGIESRIAELEKRVAALESASKI